LQHVAVPREDAGVSVASLKQPSCRKRSRQSEHDEETGAQAKSGEAGAKASSGKAGGEARFGGAEASGREGASARASKKAACSEPTLGATSGTDEPMRLQSVVPYMDVLKLGDAMEVILEALKARHVCRLARTCRGMRAFVDGNMIWRFLYRRTYWSQICRGEREARDSKAASIRVQELFRLQMPAESWKQMYADMTLFTRQRKRIKQLGRKAGKTCQPVLPCPEAGCDETFAIPQALHNHLRGAKGRGAGRNGRDPPHHAMASDGQRHYCCHEFCPRYFPTAHRALQHMQNDCKRGLQAVLLRDFGIGRFLCATCQASFRYKCAYDAHFVGTNGCLRCPSAGPIETDALHGAGMGDGEGAGVGHAEDFDVVESKLRSAFVERVKEFAEHHSLQNEQGKFTGVRTKRQKHSNRYYAKMMFLWRHICLGSYEAPVLAAIAIDAFRLAVGKVKSTRRGTMLRPATAKDLNVLSPADAAGGVKASAPLLDAQRRAGSFPKNTSSRACTSLRDQPFPMLDVAHLAAHEAAAPRPRASSKKRKREAV